MKTGDVVKVNDGSFTMEITEEGLKHTYVGMEQDQVWRVVDTGLVLPADNSVTNSSEKNNIIIQNVKDPKRFIFIQERLLKYLNCPTCKKEW